MNNQHKYPYRWTLADANFTKDKGKVFSCFACGGGSTMGYKLAGFDVIGCNEIDSRMMDVYCRNHNPKFPFLEPIQEFKKREDLPEELYNLDILDGSPPCSTFSMEGSREKAWGKMKRFQEGQSEQVLDTLFFDFIDLTEKLQSKVVVAENVKGLLIGKAKDYARRIYEAFEKAGYYCQHWLLDAQYMGVPQRRERVFFICLRKDLAEPFLKQTSLFEQLPFLHLEFNDPTIPFYEIMNFESGHSNGTLKRLWGITGKGKSLSRSSFFSYVKCDDRKPLPTISIGHGKTTPLMHPTLERYLNDEEVILGSSFPTDYNFAGQSPHYVCSMSVPPVMMAQIASQIYEQWLSKL
ncbi:DNA cytosine methyltransferase [Bacteroides heparinolyticus]|uniref:DNA cytosine methyltransferase n=1 Tax=Prevotella heparinolytica TaxID=28113 RepID=UPI003AF13F59